MVPSGGPPPSTRRPPRGRSRPRGPPGADVRLSGTCCEVHADPGPRGAPATHRVDQHVGRLEVRPHVGMPRLPPLEARRSASCLASLRARSRSSGFVVRRRPVGPADLPGAGGGTSLLAVVGAAGSGASTAGRAAARPPASRTAAATARRRTPPPRAASDSSSSAFERADRLVDPAPTDRRSRANRSGTVAIVNAAGSQPGTSSHASGVDTRASGVGRTEYADATVRSFAFWL